ncbi:hypothetical protein [Paenibacillus oralis]|uniref:hypothetical protein n=1 Tax=Paenibacillus oralis TaxID=2490856 RepID=UPI0015AED9DC|nr:hypothetical protein [Paenibacillus oralis]
MGKREDVAYLVSCIQSSNDTVVMEQIFIELVELLAKRTMYQGDINEAISYYNEKKGR